MDAPPSVGSVESGISPAGGLKKADQKRKKLVTAYILFSADVRKITMDENPGQTFGEISRIVADRWRAMSDADKQTYAERAKKLNEEKEREEREGIRKEGERMRLAPQPVARAPSPGSSVQGGVAGGQVMTRVRQDSGSGGVAAGGQGA